MSWVVITVFSFNVESLQWHGLTREEQAKYYEKVKFSKHGKFYFNYCIHFSHFHSYELWPDTFQARQERQRHMQMYPHWNARLVSLFSFWKIWRRIVAYTDITNIKYCLLSISHSATIFRRDNYRYGQKKKKRKRDKTDDPGITDWQCDWVSSLIHIYGFC